MVLHLGALHEVGSNNPDGVEIKKGPKGNRWSTDRAADGIPFHPYYTVKDMFGVGFFLILAAFIIFFAPDLRRLVPGARQLHRGQSAGDAGCTSSRSGTSPRTTRCCAWSSRDKLWGVLVMFGAIVVLFLVPWLDRSPVKSYRYRGMLSKVMLGMFVVCFVWLGKIGAGPGTDPAETIIGRVLTFLYFAFFITMPLWTQPRQDQAGAGTGDHA